MSSTPAPRPAVRPRLRLYPDVPGPRARTLVRDLLVVGLLALFAWAGAAVHDAVDTLAVLGSGVRTSGTAIEDGFGSAATAVNGIPIVGGDLAGGARGGGRRHGRAGRRARQGG